MANKVILLLVVTSLLLSQVQSFGLEDIQSRFQDIVQEISTGKDWRQVLKEQTKFFDQILASGQLDIGSLLLKQPQQNANYSILNCSIGDHKDFFKFLSYPVGILGKNIQSSQYVILDSLPDDCWGKVNVQFSLTGANSYQIRFTASQRRNLSLCSSIYSLGSSREISKFYNIDNQNFVITENNVSDEKMKAIHNFGLYVFRQCDSQEHQIGDIIQTLLLFLGGIGTSTNPDAFFFGDKPTFYQNKLNTEFIYQGNNYVWRKRKDVYVDLDDTEVQSGDFIIITRMDGVDQLIQWGAGSIVGHSVMLLEIDGVMHTVESQDGWYWPKHGIQRNTWTQWKEWARNAGFNVAILPLSDEQRAKFNVTAAVEFFKSVEGLPYGYHNFLFGWIDKVAQNIPPITTIEYLYVLFAALQRVLPGPVNSFMGEALNKRLNTTNLDLYQITNVLYERNMTLQQLFDIPEQDGWEYSDGKSYVCSAFVAGVYKAAGLFGNITIQATEFTPRDVYQLNFYNATATRPKKCINADPDLPYCQIMGKYKMDITGDQWNTKQPYQNMFEKCPSMPPYYNRPDNC